MLSRCHIRRFRGFEDLELSDLGRINLIVGRNNSGKTSLLEALALLSAGAMVRQSQGILGLRPLAFVNTGRAVRDTQWRSLFWSMHTDRSIEIDGENEKGEISLEIDLRNEREASFALGDDAASTGDGLKDMAVLEFRCRRGERRESGAIHLLSDRIVFRDSEVESVPIFCAYVATASRDVENSAIELGDLRRLNRDSLVRDALRVVEPRLKRVEPGTASGKPMIWCDLGLPEMIPLGVAGEGMMRVAQLLLSMQGLEDGIVLCDEVESGLHHSVLAETWKSLDLASRQNRTQIFATTHSIECLQAAHEALPAEALRVYRLQGHVADRPVVPYTPEALSGTFKFGFEMR